jgi:uncharacterized protein
MADQDTVEVVGRGTASADPDQVVLDLRVECPAPSVAAALAELTERVAVVTAAAAARRPAQQLVTTGVGVHPRHDRDGAVAGHTAYQQLRVTAPDPARAGDLVLHLGDAAGDSLTVESMALTLTDDGALQRRAREQAFADARSRAELYAALAGRPLAGVRGVSELLPEPGPGPRFALAAEAGLPVQPARHEVTALLRVTWALG